MTGEHGYNRYARGCRCDVCRQAKADYMRARRSTARARAVRHTDQHGYHFVPGISHGRVGYEEHGCRCPTCRAARAEQGRDLMRKRRARAAA